MVNFRDFARLSRTYPKRAFVVWSGEFWITLNDHLDGNGPWNRRRSKRWTIDDIGKIGEV